MIEICMIADSNYVIPTLTAIKSLTLNVPKNIDICINILSNNLSEYKKKELKKLETRNIKIDIKEISDLIPDIDSTHKYVTKTSLGKFIIPDIYKDKNKILYIDGDVLVLNNIKELYNMDVRNVYAAAVEDMIAVKTGLAEKVNLKRYFNSGVMLLNLKKMRDDNITQKLIEYKSKECESDFMDQNAFNTVFEDNIKFLSPTFNLLTTIKAKYNNSDIANFYNISVNELDAIYKSPVILHMAGGVKPWNNILCDNFATNLPYLCKLPKSKLRNNAVYNLFKQNPKRFIKYYILKVLNIGGIIGK